MHPLLEDPWVAAHIDKAAAPYVRIWPPEAVAAFREEMAKTLATHPAGQRLLRAAMRGGPSGKEASGEVELSAPAPAAAPAARRSGGKR